MSPLSALRSLRQLLLEDTDTSIVAGLTQLTGLMLQHAGAILDECLEHISGMTQLQLLQLDTRDFLNHEHVLSILTSLKQLTSLTLNYTMYQEEFDALLTHAPQLTSFTCNALYLEGDRSASPCSWKELVIVDQELDPQALAYIPTGSLTRLAFEGDAVFPSPSPALDFNSYVVSEPDNMPELVHKGLVNLMRCPAWQQCGPGVHLRLLVDQEDYTPERLNPLLGALAPLISKEVSLAIDMPAAAAGAPAVHQLGVTLGSSLKQLTLQECALSDDF
jgi:hypothetical protein